MSKKMVKGLLDLVLVVLLVLLYNKNVISMAFHEVGGLILCGLFLIHKGLNLSWIKAVGKKLFTPGVSGRSKAMMYLDIALFGMLCPDRRQRPGHLQGRDERRRGGTDGVLPGAGKRLNRRQRRPDSG